MEDLPYRMNCGRATVRYGKATTKPQILWDGISLISAINAPVVLDEVVPDVCSALSLLLEEDPHLGYNACDLFFESFTSSWMSLVAQGKVREAAEHWVRILTYVMRWEKASKTAIHKGTPYYFLGATYLFANDFDLGLRYLFDAIEQDQQASKRTGATDSFKKAPAYMVASLAQDPHNFLFTGLVAPTRTRLEKYLAEYRKKTGSSMQLTDFEGKFLSNTNLEFQKFVFVYLLFELIKQESSWAPSVSNDFAKMRNRAVIFDLCLVIDEVLRNKYPPADYIREGVYNLCKSEAWVPMDKDASQVNSNLNPKVSGDTALQPDIVVPALLDLSLTYRGTQVKEEMSWLLLAWHLRNYGAHDLTPQGVLVQRYDEIIQALMNALFTTLE
jgi:hypothetical protein